MAFTDTFVRADGPLGANWSPSDATHVVASNRPKVTNGGYAWYTGLSTVGPHDASITIDTSLTQSVYTGVVVKMADNLTQGYKLSIAASGGGYNVQLTKGAYNAAGVAQSFYPTALPNPTTLRLVYTAGTLAGYVNGTQWLLMRDADYDTNTRVGLSLAGNQQQITSFTTDTAVATQFFVYPTAVLTGGPPVLLTLTGIGTAWTAGTPGTPTFTTSAGSLSGQSVASASSATVWLTPPAEDGSVVITDPSTGLTATIYATGDAPPGGGGGGAAWPNPQWKAVTNRTGLAYPEGQVLMADTVVMEQEPPAPDVTVIEALNDLLSGFYVYHIPGMTLTLGQALDQLWRGVNGTLDLTGATIGTQTADSLNSMLTFLTTLFYDTENAEYIKLMDLDLGGGGIEPADLEQIRHDIGIIDQETWTNLVQILTGMWGPGADTLTTLGDELRAIRGLPLWTLGDVIDAINGLSVSVDLSPVLTLLQAMRGDTTSSLHDLHTDLDATRGYALEVRNSLAGYRTGNLYTVQTILDAIANKPVTPPFDTSQLKLGPVWPGAAHVTFGPAADLAAVTNVDGPMHGVEIEITATEPGTSYMQYDAVKAWRHIGGLVFYNDRGMCETYQALGFGRAMYVPKTMHIAQGVKLFKSHLPRGTVTPWTINP